MRRLRWYPALLAALLLWVGLSPAWGQQALSRKQQLEMVEHISRLRQQAGLEAVHLQTALTKAADAHADYLLLHGGVDHIQRQNIRKSLGVLPEDRVTAKGYPSRNVREIIARSGGDGLRAVDKLMASVYHRIQLLYPLVDEVGVGGRIQGARRVYVMELGHSEWRDLCRKQRRQSSRHSTVPQRLAYNQCANEQIKIEAGQLESLREDLLRRQPAVVLWPPHDYKIFPVLMSLEHPRPVPERRTPGNALTLQFNLSRGRPEILDWHLLERDANKDALRQVDATLVSQNNDSNQLLRQGEFALVPLDSLKHDTTYESVAVYRLNGQQQRLRWSFETQPLPWEILNLSETSTVWSDSGQAWIVLRDKNRPARPGQGLQLRGDGKIRFEIISPSTNVRLASFRGPECATAQLEYRQLSRKLRIRPPDQSDPEAYCMRKLVDSLAGQTVHGVGDLVEVYSGVNTAISLVPEDEGDRWGRVRWSAPSDCEVRAEREDELNLWVNIRCRPGKRVRFSFSKGRNFTARIR